MKKENIKYKLEVKTRTDYELEITLLCENKLFLKIFNKAKFAYLRKKGSPVKGDPEKITEFAIPKEFLKLVKIGMKRPFKTVSKLAAQDQIGLLNFDVNGSKFKRNDKNDWDIIVNMEGLYVDKR